jgi:serine/threonine-protein kinase TTK/MPS1
VQEVHQANIIHADIKPGNFLLVAGELKIIDFGMACEIPPGQNYVVRKTICGTREFMSPEVYAGLLTEDKYGGTELMEIETRSIKVTNKIDVWALGIILYQTVYGVLPFSQVPGGRISKIHALASLHNPVDFGEKYNMDPQLLDTMKRCLEKDPAKRATVEELLVHPYLRPQHQAALGPRICNNCKSWQIDMAKINYKREKKASNHFLM